MLYIQNATKAKAHVPLVRLVAVGDNWLALDWVPGSRGITLVV
jgi:hypothetical protein